MVKHLQPLVFQGKMDYNAGSIFNLIYEKKMTTNRDGLKLLNNLNIDGQYCQQIGTQVFNYYGSTTDPEYLSMCADFTDVLKDMESEVFGLLKMLPEQSN